MMIIAMPPSKVVRSGKRKREVEEASCSVEAVSGNNLKEMAPIVLMRWKTTAYKGNSVTRKLAEVLIEIENATSPGSEKRFQTTRGESEETLHQWSIVGSGYWQRIDLEVKPGHWKTSSKKNTDGAYHRHKRDDWTSGQRERRDEFHDASCVQYFTQPRISEGTVYLIIGDSLVRVLTRIQAPWQVGTLSFWGAAMPQILASLEMLEMGKVYTVTLMMGTKNASKGESRKMVRLQDKENCFLEELRIYLEPTVLTICTFPYNRMADQKAMNMNERVRHFNDIIRQMQKRSLLPVRLLHVARMMEYSLPLNSSSDGIHFNKPKGAGWLNGTFQGHINNVESDLVETNQFTLGPPPRPSFFSGRPVADPLGGRIDSRGSSRSSRIWQLGSTPMERDEVESSTPQSSGVSQVPMVEKK